MLKRCTTGVQLVNNRYMYTCTQGVPQVNQMCSTGIQKVYKRCSTGKPKVFNRYTKVYMYNR